MVKVAGLASCTMNMNASAYASPRTDQTVEMLSLEVSSMLCYELTEFEVKFSSGSPSTSPGALRRFISMVPVRQKFP